MVVQCPQRAWSSSLSGPDVYQIKNKPMGIFESFYRGYCLLCAWEYISCSTKYATLLLTAESQCLTLHALLSIVIFELLGNFNFCIPIPNSVKFRNVCRFW